MTHTPVKLTFEQYLEYDDGTDNRYELFNGKLVEMPPASPLHSDIVEFLDRLFYSEVQRKRLDWKVKRGNPFYLIMENIYPMGFKEIKKNS